MSFLRVAFTLLLLTAALPARAQTREAPASNVDVLAGIEPIREPVRTFLPRYKFESFLSSGYAGTFSSVERQWPTFVLGLEALLLRPGRFDLGVYANWHWGRPDESRARFSSAFGLELMWRVVEDSLWDLAPVLRGAYVLDWDHPGQPLVRPGVGVQISLLRFVALQAM